MTVEERFEWMVYKTESCHYWLSGCDHYGYGIVHKDGRQQKAHRVAWERENGPISPGLTIDHLCRNPSCVNPNHLEPVSQAENVRRGMSPGAILHRANKCSHGHDLNEHTSTQSKTRKSRRCLECHKLQERDRKSRMIREGK
jgi:hypothetical protein